MVHAQFVRGPGIPKFGNSFGRGFNLRTLPLSEIARHVKAFLAYARAHPELRFMVSRVGCGLAGHKDADIAPMFRDAPENCSFAGEWEEFLDEFIEECEQSGAEAAESLDAAVESHRHEREAG